MNFYQTLTAAVADIKAHGYDNAARIEGWMQRLKLSADGVLRPLHLMQSDLQHGLEDVYQRARFPGVALFTVDRIRPQLRAELDRRILASANLIKLNREEAINKTLRRFQGWATSIPIGGDRATNRGEAKADIRKSLGALPFEERRVLIDQGHKLNASLHEIVARGNNALACVWRSRWRQLGYNYRRDHRARDGRCYAVCGSWAMEKGLMKIGPDGYYDDITGAGEEPFCRCYVTWIYNVRDLPPSMLTEKGKRALAELAA